MKTATAGGLALVVGAELVAVTMPDRRAVAWLAGAAAVVALLVARRLVSGSGPTDEPLPADGPEVALRRWVMRTTTLINWSEATRRDWDRHLRPLLARQFGTAIGQSKVSNPDAYRARGEMLFGTRLWPWVDPDNVLAHRGGEPGPGRDALGEILDRLEQV